MSRAFQARGHDHERRWAASVNVISLCSIEWLLFLCLSPWYIPKGSFSTGDFLATENNTAEIADRKLLRWALKKVYERFGTQEKAAEALRISQATFSKLLGKKDRGIGFNVHQNILAALQDWPDLEEGLVLDSAFVRAVLTNNGWHVQQRYNTWLYRELNRLAIVSGPVFRILWDHPDYKPLFVKFLDHRTELPPPQDKRLWIALLRAVEPFGLAEALWGMERSWQHWHKEGDLDQSLERGLKIEKARLRQPRGFKHLSK